MVFQRQRHRVAVARRNVGKTKLCVTVVGPEQRSPEPFAALEHHGHVLARECRVVTECHYASHKAEIKMEHKD